MSKGNDAGHVSEVPNSLSGEIKTFLSSYSVDCENGRFHLEFQVVPN